MLGLCRFSLLSEGGFKTVHDSLEARRKHLYDPARLESRFHWFEQIGLPGWRAQTDHDFHLIVATGEDFPAEWLERLRDVTAGIPQISVELLPPGRHREICRKAMRQHVDAATDRVVLFRHDDDDAVAVDYVERTRIDIRRLEAMADDHPLFSLDYPTGFTLEVEGGAVHLNSQITQNLGVALNIVARPEMNVGVMDYPHHRLAAFMPGICLPEHIMYLRGKHGTNDSDAPKRGGSAFPFEPETGDALMRQRFNVDLPAFRKAVAEGRC